MKVLLRKTGGLQGIKKIGFITPSSNTALESLTAMMVQQISDRVSVHYGRVSVKSLTMSTEDVNQFQTSKMTEAALMLADAGVDVILWNGTSGAWAGRGFAADKEICAEITKNTGVPASTSSLAQLEVLAQYGISKFGLATPYVEEPVKNMIEAYKNVGFEVVSQARLNETENVVIGNTPFDKIKQLLRDADSPSAECIVVGCTNLPAAIVLDEIEDELGKPIFDSVAVTLWKALRMTEVQAPLHGWGKLLRDHEVIRALDAGLSNLLQATSASRTTIRLDIPKYGLNVDDVYAEATTKGVASLKLDSSLNQRSLATVQWMETYRKTLVQADCVNAEVPAPKALIGVYGVRAQVLSPLVWHGHLVGWISAHYVPGTRHWKAHDISAMEDAVKQARAILENAGWVTAE